MRLSVGEAAPQFAVRDFRGDAIELAALGGRPVMLSFYRYASCPICNLHIRDVMRAHASLSAAGLVMVAVFQSPPEAIAHYVGQLDVPFALVGDPDMALYRRYGVEARWTGLIGMGVLASGLRAMASGFWPGRVDGPLHRTPADFLIDAEGRIALAHYGETIDDHVPLARVRNWLTEYAAVGVTHD